MLRLVSSLAIIVQLALAAPAGATIPYQGRQASEADYERLTSAEYHRCMDESGGVTVEMRDCSAAEHDRLDGRLNAVYRTAMAQLPDNPALLRLRNLERQWLATRWDECDREAEEAGGGTLSLLVFDACALSEMVSRVAWLERYGR